MDEISIAETKPEQTDVMTPAIEFRNVSFSYDDKKVLNDLSFKLAQGVFSREFSSQSPSKRAQKELNVKLMGR